MESGKASIKNPSYSARNPHWSPHVPWDPINQSAGDTSKIWHSGSPQWTPEEDDKLRVAVELFGPNWFKIEECLKGRTTVECMSRWLFILNGSWTKQEDDAIIEYVITFGQYRWDAIAHKIPGRTTKQCKERWDNYLRQMISCAATARSGNWQRICDLYSASGSLSQEFGKMSLLP